MLYFVVEDNRNKFGSCTVIRENKIENINKYVLLFEKTIRKHKVVDV